MSATCYLLLLTTYLSPFTSSPHCLTLTMRNRILYLGLVFMLLACGKDENSGPTSAEGKWTYSTPDSKIQVTFDLVKTGSGSLDIQNPTIKVNGVSGNAAATITGVNLPTIGEIRVNANDAGLVQPYSITFTNGKVSGDFKKIEVPTGGYTYPWGTTVTLVAVAIVRP